MVGDICGETEALYLRGLNLIHNGSSYYLFNAHADVVNLTNSSGSVTKTYSYDAFGVEKNPSETDTNYFRCCGEYWDAETETYYLRARYRYAGGGVIAYDYDTITDWSTISETLIGTACIAVLAGVIIYVTGGASAPVFLF